MRFLLTILMIVNLLAMGCAGTAYKETAENVVEKDEANLVARELPKENMMGKTLDERLFAYAPVELKVPWDLLDENQVKVLENLYYASKIMDRIFLRQVWAGNSDLYRKVLEKGDPKLQKFFDINFGPWDRLEEN